MVQEAINIGINKASVYTRISHVAIQKLKNLLDKDSPDLALLLNGIRDGFREMVENRLEAFRSKNICTFQSNVCNLSFSSKYVDVENEANKSSADYKEIIDNVTRAVIEKLKS